MKRYIYELMTDQRRDPFAPVFQAIFLLLSFFYGICVSFILWLYKIKLLRSHELPKPVISIGNITVGGVGKTPLVISIVEFLRREGVRPAILIRGYMDSHSSTSHSEEIKSDEAVLLKESLPDVPVLAGAD